MKPAHSASAPAGGRTLAVLSLVLLSAALFGLLPQASQAQTYPAKPVRIIVPAAAGGSLDNSARNISDKLSEIWGQRVYVENRPGANFTIGTDLVAKAAPDGYTLLVVADGAVTINPLLYPELSYNPQRDLAPILQLGTVPLVLMVNKAVPANSVQEFVAHLQANPGKLNHASNSASTILSSELFKSLAKVEYSDINYKGASLAAASTMAGETQFCIVDVGSATALMNSGRMHALAVTSAERFKLNPEIPTLAESGVPGYVYTAGHYLFAPSKTPQAIIAKISADLTKVLAMPDVISRFSASKVQARAVGAEDVSRELRADAERWARLVKERNIKLN